MPDSGTPQKPNYRIGINLRDLDSGQKIQLAEGVVAEVVDNPRDGLWLRAKYLTYPSDPDLEGTEEQIFMDEVVGLA